VFWVTVYNAIRHQDMDKLTDSITNASLFVGMVYNRWKKIVMMGMIFLMMDVSNANILVINIVLIVKWVFVMHANLDFI